MSGYPVKLVLLGESNVGKSSLVLRFVQNKFLERTEGTIGAAFLTKSLSLDENTTIRFEIWDTAGQERYHSLAPMYYRGAPAAIVVYDIGSLSSFEKGKSWVSELRTAGDSKITIAFVGNKSDLSDKDRQVPTATGQEYAKENDLLFLESSAKDNVNVSEIFQTIAQNLPKSVLSMPITERPTPPPRASSCC